MAICSVTHRSLLSRNDEPKILTCPKTSKCSTGVDGGQGGGTGVGGGSGIGGGAGGFGTPTEFTPFNKRYHSPLRRNTCFFQLVRRRCVRVFFGRRTAVLRGLAIPSAGGRRHFVRFLRAARGAAFGCLLAA